jgi:2-polyprenyl-3-methyl-5-hydroxy-6-metoxy-1,4-benzoquinol methylase
MARFLPASYRRVLEIGCGEGAFRANLSRDCEYWGVEPNPDSAAKARAVADRVLVGTYDDVLADLPEGHFDLVICNDVIEHMEDHDRFLDSIRTRLRDGGHLVGSIPNMRYVGVLFELLVKKDWRYRGHGTLDRSHLRFFTGKSLARCLREHGFEIRDFAGINAAGRPWYALHKSLPLALLALLTLGYYRDALYLQFGFTVRK